MQITDRIVRQIQKVCEGASEGLPLTIRKFFLDMTTVFYAEVIVARF